MRSPEIGIVRGFFPGIFSWWEGIWGWGVIGISTVSAAAAAVAIAPLWGRGLMQTTDPPEGLLVAIALVWLAIAAYLYQIDFLVETRLMATANRSK